MSIELQFDGILELLGLLHLVLSDAARVLLQALMECARKLPQAPLPLHRKALHVQRLAVSHAAHLWEWPEGRARRSTEALATTLHRRSTEAHRRSTEALAHHAHGRGWHALAHGVEEWGHWTLASHHHGGRHTLAHGIHHHAWPWHHPRHHPRHVGRKSWHHAWHHAWGWWHPRHHAGHPRCPNRRLLIVALRRLRVTAFPLLLLARLLPTLLLLILLLLLLRLILPVGLIFLPLPLAALSTVSTSSRGCLELTKLLADVLVWLPRSLTVALPLDEVEVLPVNVLVLQEILDLINALSVVALIHRSGAPKVTP
mmetsp:Transcript_55589/g.119610  ORF Transcript_55589/g.119610 Transcript_55589/m.119610 type:complete len:313 (-) Transcript_55589:22-960(-)